MNQNVVVLKISWKDDTRRFRVPMGTSFQELRDDIAQKFALAEFRLKYIDEENELITVSSDRELHEAIEYLRETGPGRIIRFFVRTPDDVSFDVTQSMMNMSLCDTSRLNPFGTPPGPYSQNMGQGSNVSRSNYPPSYGSNGNYGQPSASSFIPMHQPSQTQPSSDSWRQEQQQRFPSSNQGSMDHFQQPPQQHQPQPQPISQYQMMPQQQQQPQQPQHQQPPQPVVQQVPNVVRIPPGAEVKYNSRFVRDKEMPDGTTVSPGQKCTKVWLMKNTGELPWPPGCILEWQSGDKFECTNDRVVVPEAAPQQDVDVCMEIIAPTKPGNYAGHYRMVLPNGVSFGNRVWLDFRVE